MHDYSNNTTFNSSTDVEEVDGRLLLMTTTKRAAQGRGVNMVGGEVDDE
jgi:hypothetical protein